MASRCACCLRSTVCCLSQEAVALRGCMRPSKTSSTAVGAIRTRNFGAILSRRSWDGSCRALASHDRAALRPSVQTYLGAYRVGQRPDRAVRRRSPRPPRNLASPNDPATVAMARLGIRSTPETAGRGGPPRRSSTAGRRSRRSVVLANAAGAGPRYSAHSRIAMRPRRRSAKPRSCWRRRATGRHASRSDKPVARTHSRTRDPARRRVRDKDRRCQGVSN